MSLIKVGICGASGRMGQELIRAVGLDTNMKLAAALEVQNHNNIGKDTGLVAGIGESGIKISDDQEEFFPNLNAVIDFSSANSTSSNIKKASANDCCYVLGTTGLDEETTKIIKEHSKKIGIIMSSNMSIGVNIALYLTKYVAQRLDEEYDAEIHEIHHKEKIDSPSGTGLALGQAIAEGRKIDLAQKSIYSRWGQTGERPKGSIGFSVQRGGDVVGDHTVSFVGPGERLEISHKASNRKIFANGAIKGVKWLVSQPAGLYDMKDVLGLK